MTTKELAFEYLMDCFIDWYKSIKNDNSFHYSFTKLKVIKLLFFASAVNANNEDHNLLGTFNKFVAMPFGPVESDIYNKMNQSAIGMSKSILAQIKYLTQSSNYLKSAS